MNKSGVKTASDFSFENIITIFAAFVLPAFTLYFIEVTNTSLSLCFGGITGSVAIGYCCLKKISGNTLGINFKLWAIAKIIPQTIAIGLVTIFILAIIPWLNGSSRTLYLQIEAVWYLAIVIYQEIIWRAFAELLLTKIWGKKQRLIIVSSAFLFALAHLYFRSLSVVSGSFFFGLFWAKKYSETRTISGVVVSHFCLGLILILLNYMGIKDCWHLF